MQLKKAQKHFLFENGYVTAKTLDACVEPGWKNYFIREFDWILTGQDRYGMELLYLQEKSPDHEIIYTVGLNWQGFDKERMLQL